MHDCLVSWSVAIRVLTRRDSYLGRFSVWFIVPAWTDGWWMVKIWVSTLSCVGIMPSAFATTWRTGTTPSPIRPRSLCWIVGQYNMLWWSCDWWHGDDGRERVRPGRVPVDRPDGVITRPLGSGLCGCKRGKPQEISGIRLCHIINPEDSSIRVGPVHVVVAGVPVEVDAARVAEGVAGEEPAQRGVVEAVPQQVQGVAARVAVAPLRLHPVVGVVQAGRAALHPELSLAAVYKLFRSTCRGTGLSQFSGRVPATSVPS